MSSWITVELLSIIYEVFHSSTEQKSFTRISYFSSISFWTFFLVEEKEIKY